MWKRARSKHYLAHKELARQFVQKRVATFAQMHGFQYKRIAIRNNKRSWASCSELGNLNFHYKIIFLPLHLVDYIIVHELCHLRELNHSSRFWAHVERIVPDHKDRRKELRLAEREPMRKYIDRKL